MAKNIDRDKLEIIIMAHASIDHPFILIIQQKFTLEF